MYETIESLCSQKGINISKLCNELDIRRSVFSELKSGRTKKLSAKTLNKIAKYFGVTVDYLINVDNDYEVLDSETPIDLDSKAKVALFGDCEVTDEMWEEVKNFVDYIKQKYKQK